MRGSVVLALFVVLVCSGAVSAQVVTWTATTSGNWSSTSTWTPPASGATGSLPSAQDAVEIDSGVDVLLDVDYVENVPLASLTINGSLTFTPSVGATRSLAADRVLVGGTGRLIIGAGPNARFTDEAELVLTGSTADEERALIVRPGGELRMHGRSIDKPWVQLDRNVTAGAAPTLFVDGRVSDWPVGSQIVLASTDFDMDEAEVLTLAGVSPDGRSLTTSGTLVNEHFGSYSASYNGRRVDMRGEVALIDRNIVIRGPAGSAPHGAHMMFMGTTDGMEPGSGNSGPPPIIQLDGVELHDMGRSGALGRYPIHFHFAGHLSSSYVKRCSIHHSNFRALSIHFSHHLLVEDNVAFDIAGHAYYLEDGREIGNIFRGNLGFVTRKAPVVMRPNPFHDPSVPGSTPTVSSHDDEPSTFWITNPENIFEDNHAAGSEDAGFWFEYHDPSSRGGPPSANPTDPLNLKHTLFARNTAHSNKRYGVFDDDFGWSGTGQMATALWPDTTVYKNGHHGFWVRAYGLLRTPGLRAADNPSALYFASSAFVGNEQATFILEGALIIGESANTGDPQLAGPGTSLPAGLPAGFTPPNDDLIGVELYDGLIRLVDCDFAHFSSSAQRRAGAIGPNYTDESLSIDPRVIVESLQFHPTAAAADCNPLWMRPSLKANTNQALVVTCKDGSIASVPGTKLVAATYQPNPTLSFMAAGTGATYQADWNAHEVPASWTAPTLNTLTSAGTYGQVVCGYYTGATPPDTHLDLVEVSSSLKRTVLVDQDIFFRTNVRAGTTYRVEDGQAATRRGTFVTTWGFGAPLSHVILAIPAPVQPSSVSYYFSQPSSELNGQGSQYLPMAFGPTSYAPITTSASLATFSTDLTPCAWDAVQKVFYVKLLMLDGTTVPNHPLTPNRPAYRDLYPGDIDLQGFTCVAELTFP